jgi:hypothetical protein
LCSHPSRLRVRVQLSQTPGFLMLSILGSLRQPGHVGGLTHHMATREELFPRTPFLDRHAIYAKDCPAFLAPAEPSPRGCAGPSRSGPSPGVLSFRSSCQSVLMPITKRGFALLRFRATPATPGLQALSCSRYHVKGFRCRRSTRIRDMAFGFRSLRFACWSISSFLHCSITCSPSFTS